MQLDPNEAKQRSRGISSDMSPEAVARRVQICSDLSDACREMGKAIPVVPAPVENDGNVTPEQS